MDHPGRVHRACVPGDAPRAGIERFNDKALFDGAVAWAAAEESLGAKVHEGERRAGVAGLPAGLRAGKGSTWQGGSGGGEAEEVAAAAPDPRRAAFELRATTWHCTLEPRRSSRPRAMCVACVNYHGSSGFGYRLHSTRITHRFGARSSSQDIEAATDTLAEANRGCRCASACSPAAVQLRRLHGGLDERPCRKPGRYAAYVCHAGCFDWDGDVRRRRLHLAFPQRTGRLPTGTTRRKRRLAQSPHHFAADHASRRPS